MISNFPDEPPPFGVPVTPEQMRSIALCPSCAQAVIGMAVLQMEKDLGISFEDLPGDKPFDADFDLKACTITLTVEGHGSKTYPVMSFEIPECD